MNGRELIHKPYFWLIVVCLVWLATSLPSLMTYPAPYSDEWWLGSISVSLLESGRFDSFYPDILIYKDYSIFRLYNIGLALTYKLFGVGLIQGRVFSMAGAFTGGVLVYWLGNKLYNPWVGISAAALYWLSPRVLWLSHVVRPDMWVNVGELILLIVFWKVQSIRSERLAFVLGALAIGLLDIYLPVVFISLAVSCAMVIRFYRPEDWKFLFVYGAGCLAGLAFYVLSRFTPEGQLHAWLPWLLGNFRGSLGDSRVFISQIEDIFKSGFIGYSRIGLLESACYILGLLWLGLRRNTADVLLLIAVIWALSGAALIGTGNHHLVYLMPILSITTAAGLMGLGEWLVERLGKPSPSSLCGIRIFMLGPLALAYVVGGLFVAWQSRLIDYAGYEEKLRSLVPAHSRVLGEGTWWGSLREANFFVEEQLLLGGLPIDADNSSLVHPGLSKSMTELIRLKRIDTLLIDEGFTFMRPELLPPLSQTFHEELLRYALSNCRLAGVVEGYMYGYEGGGVALRRTEVYTCP